MTSDLASCDWLQCLGNDVQLHLVVVIKYKSAERSHVQLQFHPDFQREKVRKSALQLLSGVKMVDLSKFDTNWCQVSPTQNTQFPVGVSVDH